MISSSSPASIPQRQDNGQAHDSAAPYRSSSRHRLSGSVPRSQTQTPASASDASSRARPAPAAAAQPAARTTSGGASRFPSPPPSSSPAAAPGPVAADDANRASMAHQMGDAVSAPGMHQQPPSVNPAAPQGQQQPSPTSDDSPATCPGPWLRLNVIHVRDLQHIEKLAEADLAGAPDRSGILHDPPLHQTKYEISAMPIADVIEMVAALLTKITTTNDLQHDAMQRNVAHQQQANQSADAHGSSQMSPLSHSVLAFHGKNVPAITILSYLSRIDKYCPTTYEVFLSLLVYFDRMTERVNDMVSRTERSRRSSRTRGSASVASHDTPMGDASRSPDDSDEDLADDDDSEDEVMVEPPTKFAREASRNAAAHVGERSVGLPTPATYFVVDSFNIHRLIIAGVTCSSKFFSDVFYTNSRYAKVGGLPLPELNHLELQFLILNDFRLAIPVEELEAYATMLVEFYAREVVAPRLRRT
ncbi:cyclin-domain-containing protein [Trichoderma citrinoviride]|uniref:Cyclin-domain-containing protein n=1 Tax=Trichoderma citrinoviride TaxID=58853 RepID=A0A2T4AZT8_9HYPO|nr:cyclin-domain-containing protein [Trichoderma citrinoviride]PTB62587.1 cyclin-domain-containing protein [Trichoderma citrinoviride]